MFRKRDADPMAKEDEDYLDLQAETILKEGEDTLDLQAETILKEGEDTLDLHAETILKEGEDTLDLQAESISKEDEQILELLAEDIPKTDPAPIELTVDPIDPSESQPLSASPKISPATGVQTSNRNDAQANKRLIVGEGIRLSGEINSCDRLVVEGEVEVTLNDTLALEITSSGRFTGGCEVEEADISGIYEGDLTVRNTLFVRGTGRITGTIRYGQLELERGGQIAGNISVLGNESTPSANVGTKSRIAKAPLFGDGKPSS